MTCLSKQAYQPGDVVLANCKPFIKILHKQYKGIRCDWCFKINPTLSKCIRCKKMNYCDTKCQTQDWKNGHKFECSLSRFAENICDNPNWLVLQIILRIYATLTINSKKTTEGLPVPDGTVRSFKNLLDHAKAEQDDVALITVLCKLKILLELEGHYVEVEELLKYFSINKTNGFAIYNDQETDKIGSGLYVQTSVFDHSCKPNVFFVTSGTEMQIRAIGPIEVGESICISYISAHIGRDARRKTLMERYRFDCNCERCAANLDVDLPFRDLTNLIGDMRTAAYHDGRSKHFFATAALHNQILGMLKTMYHEYDDRITNQYVRMFAVMEGCVQNLDKSIVEPFLKEILDHVLITYGNDHYECKSLSQNFTRCGFGYLL